MGNGDNDRQAFKALWTTWKAGKGKPETDPDKVKLLATATRLLGGAAEGFCEASLRYLQSVRRDMLRRVQEDARQQGADPVRLLRGLRGGSADDLSFRLHERVAVDRLLSYSSRIAGGITFASMGDKPGLVYELPVAHGDIVFYEDPALCNEYPAENEVLVLHLKQPGKPSVAQRDVPKRAKMKFSKTEVTDVPRNVTVVEATRTHLVDERMLRLFNCKPMAMDWMLDDAAKGGAAACVLVDAQPVGAAIIASADRSLSVLVDPVLHRAGLGELVARKAISLAFERGLPDVTARARPGTSGAGLAKRLRLTQSGANAGEVFFTARREGWGE